MTFNSGGFGSPGSLVIIGGGAGDGGAVVGTPPLSYDDPTRTMSIDKASATQDGYLAKEDFFAFSAVINPIASYTAPINWNPATRAIGVDPATAAQPGHVTIAAQSFAGKKTFTSGAAITGGSLTTTGDEAYASEDGAIVVRSDASTDTAIGQAVDIRVINQTVGALNQISLVYFTGASGKKVSVDKASSATEAQIVKLMGWMTSTVAAGGSGFARVRGVIDGVKTDVDSDGNVLAAGDYLYVSAIVPGGFSKTKPSNGRLCGIVLEAHAVTGKILCNVNPYMAGDSISIKLDDVMDVTAPTPLDYDLLAWSASSSRWINIRNALFSALEPVGIEDASAVTLSWSDVTRTLTASGTYYIWNKTPSRITANKTWTISNPANKGLYFCFVNSAGADVIQQTPWSIISDVSYAIIYWDGTKGTVFDERHGIAMDSATHRYLHSTFGTQYVSGGDISGFTTGVYSDVAITFGLSQTIFADEDLRTTVATAVDPLNASIWYRQAGGTNWTWDAPTGIVVKHIAGVPQYDNVGVQTPIANTNYFNVWICAVPSLAGSTQFVAIQPQASWTTPDAAANESFSTLNFADFPFTEVAPLWKITYQYRAAQGGTANVRMFVSPTDIRKTRAPSSGYTPTPSALLRTILTGSGTFNIPTGARMIEVIAVGAGGGGGGGSGRNNNGTAYGGGGGGGGIVTRRVFLTSELASSVVYACGAGGIGGNGRANGSGSAGVRGGSTSFGTFLYASGGNGGNGGTQAATAVGGTVTTAFFHGNASASENSSSGSGGGSNSAGLNGSTGPGGGGGGGNGGTINSDGAYSGVGYANYVVAPSVSGQTGATGLLGLIGGAAATTGAANPGTSATVVGYGGSGSGGVNDGTNANRTGAAAGNGYFGGGGGGGGGVRCNGGTGTGGAGGNGGDGYIEIIIW